MDLLWKKTLDTNRKRHGNPKKANLKSEIGAWASCLSATLIYVLCTSILLQSNDVETNPGPGPTDHGCIAERILKSLTSAFEALSLKVRNQEQIIERLENMKHQMNIKVIGLLEDHIDGQSSLDKVIKLLNKYSSDPNWRADDIAHAYRQGDLKKIHDTNPRPLIVCFRLAEDKSYILQDARLRRALKEQESIKLAADLSPKQQSQLNYYRDRGLRAYFKNNKLCIEDNNGHDPRHFDKNFMTNYGTPEHPIEIRRQQYGQVNDENDKYNRRNDHQNNGRDQYNRYNYHNATPAFQPPSNYQNFNDSENPQFYQDDYKQMPNEYDPRSYRNIYVPNRPTTQDSMIGQHDFSNSNPIHSFDNLSETPYDIDRNRQKFAEDDRNYCEVVKHFANQNEDVTSTRFSNQQMNSWANNNPPNQQAKPSYSQKSTFPPTHPPPSYQKRMFHDSEFPTTLNQNNKRKGSPLPDTPGDSPITVYSNDKFKMKTQSSPEIWPYHPLVGPPITIYPNDNFELKSPPDMPTHQLTCNPAPSFSQLNLTQSAIPRNFTFGEKIEDRNKAKANFGNISPILSGHLSSHKITPGITNHKLSTETKCKNGKLSLNTEIKSNTLNQNISTATNNAKMKETCDASTNVSLIREDQNEKGNMIQSNQTSNLSNKTETRDIATNVSSNVHVETHSKVQESKQNNQSTNPPNNQQPIVPSTDRHGDDNDDDFHDASDQWLMNIDITAAGGADSSSIPTTSDKIDTNRESTPIPGQSNQPPSAQPTTNQLTGAAKTDNTGNDSKVPNSKVASKSTTSQPKKLPPNKNYINIRRNSTGSLNAKSLTNKSTKAANDAKSKAKNNAAENNNQKSKTKDNAKTTVNSKDSCETDERVTRSKTNAKPNEKADNRQRLLTDFSNKEN